MTSARGYAAHDPQSPLRAFAFERQEPRERDVQIQVLGAGVTTHAVGDIVGAGCMIDNCRHCKPCKLGLQSNCEGPNNWPATCNGPLVPARLAPGGLNAYGRDNTYGGYSDALVVRDDFLIRTPPALKPEVAAPVLCAASPPAESMAHRCEP